MFYRKTLPRCHIKVSLYLQTLGLTSPIPRGNNTISPVHRCRSCYPQVYDQLFASKLQCTFPVTNYCGCGCCLNVQRTQLINLYVITHERRDKYNNFYGLLSNTFTTLTRGELEYLAWKKRD